MASLLDMRRRIKSVKNTQQITKAMKMVAAAKLKRAQDRVTASRPFAGKMSEVLGGLSAKVADEISHPLLDRARRREISHRTGQCRQGPCGCVQRECDQGDTGISRRRMRQNRRELIAVGRKGRDFFKRRTVEITDEYIGLTGSGQVKHQDALEIARQDHQDDLPRTRRSTKCFSSLRSSRRYFLRSRSSNSYLPIPPVLTNEEAEPAPQAEYIYEQPPPRSLAGCLPKQVETQIYKGMIESVASEQGSRMTAMDSASKNAGELIDTLTLNMNRIRQAAITKEIIEVVSGAAAL